LSFAKGAWSVRDLGSRNGTLVDGARIEAGGTRALAAGARLAFGNPAAEWTLVDASPPVAVARRFGGDGLIAAVDGMLALPSPDAPVVCVLESYGAWIAEVGGEARPATDGEQLFVDGQTFVLHLPEAGLQSTAVAGAADHLDEVALSLRVSRDEE